MLAGDTNDKTIVSVSLRLRHLFDSDGFGINSCVVLFSPSSSVDKMGNHGIFSAGHRMVRPHIF
jgi:hypothetical protein